MTQPPVRSADYSRLAPVYTLVTRMLTGLGAERTQRRLLQHIAPGDRVLDAGCGPGPFNAELAQAGAEVTFLDYSPAMVARARRRVEAACGTAEPHHFVTGDVMAHAPDQPYDVVIAAFFLNTFAWEDSRLVLAHLCDLVAEDGTLCIADEGRSEHRLTAALLDLVRKPTLRLYGFFTGQPAHDLYDYDPVLQDQGWQIHDRSRDRRDYLVATAWRRRPSA